MEKHLIELSGYIVQKELMLLLERQEAVFSS